MTNELCVWVQSEDGGDEAPKQRVVEELFSLQQRISEWRDELLQKPLMNAKKLTYPKEIEVYSRQK